MKNKILMSLTILAICLLSIITVQAAGCSGGICCDKDLWAQMSENEVKIFTSNNVEYEIEVLVISETSNEVKFKVNGEITDALNEGEEDNLADGSIIEVKKIFTENGVSKVIFCFNYGILQCNGVIGELVEGEKETYNIGNSEYEIKADLYQGNFRLIVNGEYTAWLYLNTEHTMSNGLHIKVIHMTSTGPKIKFCLTQGPAPSTPAPETSKPRVGIDLSNYPKLFVDGSKLNAMLVVGDQAPADDVIASVDITVSFQKLGATPSLSASALASEIGDYNRNIISVGRPCDNAVTAQILRSNGISEYDSDCSYRLKPGQAIVYLFDYNGYAHMLVFGYSKMETRQAARALQTKAMSGRKQLLDFSGGMPTPEDYTEPQPERPDKTDSYKQCLENYYNKARDQRFVWQNYPEADRLLEEGQRVCGEKFGMPIPGPSRPAEEITECMKEVEKFKKELIEKYDSKGIQTPEDLMRKYEEMHMRCTNEIITPERTTLPIEETKDKECVGCRKNDACMQFGIRLVENKVPVYCDIDSALKPQKENGKECQNSYECLSNSCNDGVCQSISEKIEGIRQDLQEQKGILEKIFGFFKKIFG